MKRGTLASKGFAIGKVLILSHEAPVVKKERESLEKEVVRLKEATEESVEALKTLKKLNESRLDEEHLAIFDAHIEMIKDIEIMNQTKAMLETEEVSAAYAYQKVTDQFIAIFEGMDDEYFKARASDIKDIQRRMLNILTGAKKRDVALLDEDTIVVAHDLTPSDTASFNYDFVKGLVTEVGGITSHTAIMARAFNIPAFVGVTDALDTVKDNDVLILDGAHETITINPDEKTLEQARLKQKELEEKQAKLDVFKDKNTVLKDGSTLHLKANIGGVNDIQGILNVGAEGIGLFRTEFMFMDRKKAPTLEEQVTAYQEVFEAVDSVIVRTLDIGGDKHLDYMSLPKEENPFLGKRAIRLCFDEVELFKTQLKALLIAGVKTKELMIMLPMVARVDEIHRAKRILDEVKSALDEEKLPYQKDVKLGIMIEIPAAALNARRLAKEVDFFSIGTNDLMQYMYASDRMNEALSYLYEPFDPVFLRLIETIVVEAHKENTPVSVCGELAGDLNAALILIGLGIDSLSMSPGAILEIREALTHYTKEELTQFAQEVIHLDTFEEVKARFKK